MTGTKDKTIQVELTDEQKRAIAFVVDNLDAGVVALSGPAGSGKTTLLKVLRETLQKYGVVTVCATTNKAANVLRTKGIDDCQTMHQVCLRPFFRPPIDELGDYLSMADVVPDNDKIEIPDDLFISYGEPKLHQALDTARRSSVTAAMRQLGIPNAMDYLIGWLECGAKAGTVLIDEASMVGDEDLEKVCRVFRRVVLIGDENQLPPVKAKPAFWDVPTRFRLTQIHRQAEGSQPLQLANIARQGEKPPMSPVVRINPQLCADGVPVIVWRNKCRIEITEKIRKALGYDKMPPQPGEYLISKGGDKKAKDRGLINNTVWQVTKANGFRCDLINDIGEELHGEHVFMEELNQGDGNEFRFGYCITAHTAQGSEWPKVQIFTPDASAYFNFKKSEASQWLYTAITRARDQVIWVS